MCFVRTLLFNVESGWKPIARGTNITKDEPIPDHRGRLNSSLPVQNGGHFADDIFRCIFVNESFVFWFQFHWSLFQKSNWQCLIIGLDSGLVPNRLQGVIWTTFEPIHWRIYTAPCVGVGLEWVGGGEFNHPSIDCVLSTCLHFSDGGQTYQIFMSSTHESLP